MAFVHFYINVVGNTFLPSMTMYKAGPVYVWIKRVNRRLPADPSALIYFGYLCLESQGTLSTVFKIVEEINRLLLLLLLLLPFCGPLDFVWDYPGEPVSER